MQYIKDWRLCSKKISNHNITMGKYNQEIGVIRDKIGVLNQEIGKIKDIIGEHKFRISINENRMKETPYYWTRRWVENNLPDVLQSYDDSVSQGQFESKKWLIEELQKINFPQPLHIEIIGGWFGYPLIEMLESIVSIKQIDFYEIDNNCKKVLFQHINNFKPNYKIAVFDDYFERTEKRRRDLVINTSSEHMRNIYPMKQYYKGNPIIAIQSNNYELDDHINCVTDEKELIKNTKIRKVLFSGQLELEMYKRFMVIGIW